MARDASASLGESPSTSLGTNGSGSDFPTDALVEFGTRVSKPWKLSESQPIAMALPVDGKATLIALGDGSLIVVNSQSGERLARLVTTASGWAVLDYSGRFDGNTTGIEAVSWQSDIKTLELSDLARKYFEPGMLSNVIAGSLASLAAIPASLGDSVAMPPKVELKVSEEGPRQPGMPFQVAVIVEDLGGGMDDIRLFHNGKLVDKGALVQTQNFAEQKRKFRGLVFNVVPTAGLNTFRATAKSIEGIEAGSQRLSQTFGGNASNGRLHILAVGIDDYLAPIPPLRLAAKDADELRKRIAAGSKSFAGQSQTVLLNEKATRESVLGALASIGRDAAPEDTIVVFLAGHGVSVSDREWLFLPWGADGSSIPALKRTSISSQSLQDVLVGAKAHRIVLAIDACQSGAAFGAFAEQRTAFLRLLSNVSRDTGIVVYAATQDGSDSYEIETLGHGIFTYAMMEGLNQKSRTGSQQVTAFELADYVEQTVPSLAQLYKLGRQDSATFRLGVDFPVATRMK